MSELICMPGGAGLPEGFVEVPFDVYASDPMWIPEDSRRVAAAFSSANPWFRGGEALAICHPGGARAAAFFSPTTEVDGRPSVFFGFFETLGDASATRAVMAAVDDFARRHGARDIYGPIDFSTYSRNRLRISAEPGAVTFPGEPYNPPSYPGWIQESGYTEFQRYVTQMPSEKEALAAVEHGRPQLERLKAEGYVFEHLTPELWSARMPQMHELADAIFSSNLAYTPLPPAEFQSACGPTFIQSSCPHTSMVIYGPAGDVAAAIISFPHYGPLVVQSAGSARVAVSELSFAKHFPLLEQRRWRIALGKTLGVMPAHRSKGLMTALVTEASLRAAGHYDRQYHPLIRVGNFSERYLAGEIPCRLYALYHKKLV